MGIIKKFDVFVKNENLDQSEIDRLLDKIGSNGINSLNKYEKEKLDNIGNNNYDPRKKLINELKEIVTRYGGYITMGEMESESSPSYKTIDQQVHLIEVVSSNGVGVVVYGGYKYETVLEEYDVDYEKLDMDILIEIKEIIDNAIEFEMIEEDI